MHLRMTGSRIQNVERSLQHFSSKPLYHGGEIRTFLYRKGIIDPANKISALAEANGETRL